MCGGFNVQSSGSTKVVLFSSCALSGVGNRDRDTSFAAAAAAAVRRGDCGEGVLVPLARGTGERMSFE